MKIKQLVLKDYRGIENTTFDLLENLNVFVGINGSGKTSVLDAIVTSLSWLVNRIQRENASGRPITDLSIKNGADFSRIGITLSEAKENYQWQIVKLARGNSLKEKSDLTELSRLAIYFQKKIKANLPIPVIAYYPINRVVETIEPKISSKQNLNILDVYDNALFGKTNYHSFFEWFRLQDDIVNEKAQSRSKWMIKNKGLLKRKTNRLLVYLKKIAQESEVDNDEFEKVIKRFSKDELLYEEPVNLFRELENVLFSIEFKLGKNFEFRKIIHEIGFLLYRMSSTSESGKDNIIDSDRVLITVVERVVSQIEEYNNSYRSEEDFKLIASFLWEALSFSILLSLWWCSDKGKKEIETLLNQFSPTKLKFDSQQEYKVFIESISGIVKNDAQRLDKATRGEGRELKYVTRTIEEFISGYSNLRIQRLPRPHLLVDKNNQSINLDQLSDGEKNIIALVGDIARRLSIANPYDSNPLNGDGIIIIDEIDLHLHPGWQRLMIPKLTELFPNCQFIITTHSPQILSHIKPESIFLLNSQKNIFSYSKAIESFGRNSDRILEDLLGVDARPGKEKQMLRLLFKLIQDGKLGEAKNLVKELNNPNELKGDPELAKAEILLKRKEIIGK